MSVLSNRDFYKEFGKSIFIFPFVAKNIKGASVNLTASEFAWNVNTKERIFPQPGDSGKKNIIVPPNTPVAIMTCEAISVSNKICGTYHSRVSKVSQGFNHISTTLDPGYFGTSLISLLNNSNEPKEITIGEAFVTVMFYYLKSNSLKTTDRGQNMINRFDVIAEFAYDLSDFIKYTRKNVYLASKDDLERIMQRDKHFIKWKKYFLRKDKELQKVIRFKKIVSHITVGAIMVFMALGLVKFALQFLGKYYHVDITNEIMIELFVSIFTLLCYGLRLLYTNIYRKWFDGLLEKRVSEEVERTPPGTIVSAG